MNWKYILLATVLLLGGCFDFEETLYLKVDGSGRGDMHYSVPFKLMEMQGFDIPKSGVPLTADAMKEHFESREGVTLTGGSYREEGNLKIINISFTFEKIENMSELGMIYDWKVEDGERVFSINLHRSGKAQVSSPLRAMFLQNMDTHGFRFNIYFPRKLSFANAQSQGGNVARWFVPLSWMAGAGSKEKILEARFPMTTSERMKAWFSDLFADEK